MRAAEAYKVQSEQKEVFGLEKDFPLCFCDKIEVVYESLPKNGLILQT